MIVGYDSCKHKKGRRYAITATTNKHFSKFFSDVVFNESSSDVGPIGEMMNTCLNNFKHINGVYPNRVIIYRAGTSESEKKLYSYEYLTLEQIFKNYKTGFLNSNPPEIKFTYIHVNKKTSIKFFQKNEDEEKPTFINPISGLVIDNTITHPDKYEFYLQPQFVGLKCGTATPVHYEVLYDSIEMSIEELEKVSFNLCFYYWNWNGPVRLPAPLKNAETLNTFKSKIDSEGITNVRLVNVPYFI